MDKALDDLVQQLEWQDATRTRVREAAAYPLLIVGLLTVLLTVLVGFTIPRFARVYQSVNANIELPQPTRVVQAAGTFLAANSLVILAALAVAYVLYRIRVQAPGGPEWRDRWLLRLPVVGDVSRKLALSRFAHFFGSLHESGVEVAPSLAVIERVIGNAYIARRFRTAVSRVLAGDPLSKALGSVGEFSPLVIQMVALGEKTGQMSKSLQQVRQYYDREVDRSVTRAIGVFGWFAIPSPLGEMPWLHKATEIVHGIAAKVLLFILSVHILAALKHALLERLMHYYYYVGQRGEGATPDTVASAEIARFLNENYIAVKVDREERPDVDAIYMKAVQGFGADLEVAPKKGYVSLRRKKQFALVQPSTKTRLDLGINLKGKPPAGRLEASGSFNAMVSHRVRLESAKDVDAEVVGWLKEAFDAAG